MSKLDSTEKSDRSYWHSLLGDGTNEFFLTPVFKLTLGVCVIISFKTCLRIRQSRRKLLHKIPLYIHIDSHHGYLCNFDDGHRSDQTLQLQKVY